MYKPFNIPRPPGDESIYNEVNSGIYERYYTLKSADVVVDIGAHVGYFTMRAAEKVAYVYAFEPEPHNFMLLKKNTYYLNNVEIHNKAVWNNTFSNETMFYHPQNSGGHSLIYTSHVEILGLKTETIALDDVGFPKPITFIKMDCEGSEIWVFPGAVEVLKTYKPVLAMEVHDQNCRDIVEKYLKDFNYRFVANNESGPCMMYAEPR